MNKKNIFSKKRKAYISINLLFILIFITIVFSYVFLVEKNTAIFIKENVDIVIGDYISEQSLKVTKINFYRAIENTFYKSKNENEFFNLMSQVNGKEFYRAKEMIYFYSEKIKIDILDKTGQSIISEDKRYMDFTIQITYQDKKYLRSYKKKVRIFNPYRCMKNKNINSEETKKLFIYLR